MSKSKPLPLVQLSLLRPLVQGLRERGIDAASVLESAGLTEAAVASGDAAVHVMVIHQFTEACARAVGDPTFCAGVGLQLSTNGWPMIAEARHSAQTLGDFLNIYVSRANEVSTSVTAYLDIRGDMASFGEERTFRPTIVPAQNDGFMIALALSILEGAMGPGLDASEMMLVICDPAVLPKRFRKYQVLRGDRMGFRIQFPSCWLTQPVASTEGSPRKSGKADRPSAQDFLLGVRSLFRQHVGEGGLDVERAALLVAMSRWKLARRLAAYDTDISSEIARAKWAFVEDRLKNSAQPMAEIAVSVGYSDPANFSRAYARAKGFSPRQFRKQQKAGSI